MARCSWSALALRKLSLAGVLVLAGFGKADDARQIVVRVSRDWIAPLIERPIDETLAVDEEILGVRALGNAEVMAQPLLVVADDPHSAAFTVLLTGTIRSQTVGRKGPVEIYSRSQGRFTAAKRVAFQPGRGFIGEPASVAVQTSSTTDRIVPGRGGPLGRAIERRAWIRVAQSRPEVERIVQAKTEAQIRAAFDRLLDGRLARVNWLAEQRLLIATALGAAGEPAYACSTSRLGWQIAASSVHPARITLPLANPAGPPIQVWVHEQVVGERLALWLRQADLIRRLVEAALAPREPVSETADALGGDSSGVATIGDWILFRANLRSTQRPAVPAH